MVGLVGGAIETEAHEAHEPDEQAIKFIETSVLPEESVGSLVKTDGSTMHQMAGDQDEWHREPEGFPAVYDCRHGQLGHKKQDDDDLKRGAAHPVGFLLISGAVRVVNHSEFMRVDVNMSGDLQISIRQA